MKSEPEVYSIQNLKKDKKTQWEGVRNYQARNFMRSMQIGERVLFYHSNAEPSGIAGLARVSQVNLVDPTQFKRQSPYFDPMAKLSQPRWFCVELAFICQFPHFVSLAELREQPRLQKMLVLQKGQRLSVQPVQSSEFELVCKLAGVRTNEDLA